MRGSEKGKEGKNERGSEKRKEEGDSDNFSTVQLEPKPRLPGLYFLFSPSIYLYSLSLSSLLIFFFFFFGTRQSPRGSRI